MSNQLSWSIIKHFALKNRYGFSFREVVEEFPENNPTYLGDLLGFMVGWGMLCKISRNNYHIIPLNADPGTYAPDGLQVAKNIIQGNEYYFGFASALRLHGLRPQSKIVDSKNEETRGSDSQSKEARGDDSKNKASRVEETEGIEYIVTKKQMRPAVRVVGGTRFQFIQHKASRFFGFESSWINNLEKAPVSDIERTIVDVTTQPQFCGGIVELGYAIYLAENKIDRDKLFNYFERNMNKVAKKRYLFLIELLGLHWTAGHERMLKELGSAISLLDPSAPDKGRSRKEFGLKINVDPYYIRHMIVGTGKG